MQKLVSNRLLQINSFSVIQIGDDVYLRVLYVFYDIFTYNVYCNLKVNAT